MPAVKSSTEANVGKRLYVAGRLPSRLAYRGVVYKETDYVFLLTNDIGGKAKVLKASNLWIAIDASVPPHVVLEAFDKAVSKHEPALVMQRTELASAESTCFGEAINALSQFNPTMEAMKDDEISTPAG